ncbi:hypothetical protein SDJN02_25863, partial [Cucurbita argyrosperma subsp. argyrosperma]
MSDSHNGNVYSCLAMRPVRSGVKGLPLERLCKLSMRATAPGPKGYRTDPTTVELHQKRTDDQSCGKKMVNQ